MIRGITQISDKDNFFAGLVRVRSQVSKSESKVVLTDAGLVEINGELHVHPMRFWEIDKQQREFILGATKNLKQGVWTQKHFNQEVRTHKRKINNFEHKKSCKKSSIIILQMVK